MQLSISNMHVPEVEVLTFVLAFSEKLDFILSLQTGSKDYDPYAATSKSQFPNYQWLFNEWDFVALDFILWRALVFKNFFLDSIALNFKESKFRIDYLSYSICLQALIHFANCKIKHSLQVTANYLTIASSSK